MRALRAEPALWALVCVGAALRLYPIWFGLPYLNARPDEAVAVGHALDVLDGRFNPGFFHWPSLTFYVLAAVFAVVSGAQRLLPLEAGLNPVEAVVVARATVAVAGTATLLAVFSIGRRAAGRDAGLLAAGFLAVAILHVRDSHFAMTDVLMTLLATASLAVLLRAVDDACARGAERPIPLRLFALAGLLGGLATSTKYNAAAIAAGMAAAQVLLWVRRRQRPWGAAAWLPAVAYGIAFAAGFVGATPYAVLDYPRFSADLLFDFTHLSGGHGIDLGRGWTYHLRRSLPYGVGLTVVPAALAGIPALVRASPRHALIAGAYALALYAALGSGYTVFFRYVLPLVPIACLLAGVGVRDAAAWLAARAGMRPRVALGLLLLLTAGPALVNVVWMDVLLARTDTRVLAGEWLEPRLRPDDSVYDAGGDYVRLDLRTDFHYWVWDDGRGSFGHPEGRVPDWLVLPQSPLRTYAHAPRRVRQLAAEAYEVAFTVRGTRGAAGTAVYDLQDAFFMPFSAFGTVERPGPTIVIHRLRDPAYRLAR